MGAVGFGLVLGAVRLGWAVLREQVTTHGHSTPCGGLVWRTSSEVHQPVLWGRAWTASTSRLERTNGALVQDDVEVFACRFLEGTVAVVQRSAPGNQDVKFFDTGTGALRKTVHVDHRVDALSFSPRGNDMAAFSNEASAPALSILDVASSGTGTAGGKPAVVLSRDRGLLATGHAWSDKDRFCWVQGQRPTSDTNGTAELWCWTSKEGTTSMTLVAWTGGGTSAPWVGYHASLPHLCGEDLRPKDLECRGIKRPD
jgi:hypothetical protein